MALTEDDKRPSESQHTSKDEDLQMHDLADVALPVGDDKDLDDDFLLDLGTSTLQDDHLEAEAQAPEAPLPPDFLLHRGTGTPQDDHLVTQAQAPESDLPPHPDAQKALSDAEPSEETMDVKNLKQPLESLVTADDPLGGQDRPYQLNAAYKSSIQHGVFRFGQQISQFIKMKAGADLPKQCGKPQTAKTCLVRYESAGQLHTVPWQMYVRMFLRLQNPTVRLQATIVRLSPGIELPLSMEFLAGCRVWHPWQKHTTDEAERFDRIRLKSRPDRAIIQLDLKSSQGRARQQPLKTGSPTSELSSEMESMHKTLCGADKIFIYLTVGSATLFQVDWLWKLVKYLEGQEFRWYLDQQSPLTGWDTWNTAFSTPAMPSWMIPPPPPKSSRKNRHATPETRDIRYSSVLVQDRFHAGTELEAIFGIALRRERERQAADLLHLFNEVRGFKVSWMRHPRYKALWYAHVTMLTDPGVRCPVLPTNTVVNIEFGGSRNEEPVSITGSVAPGTTDQGQTFTVVTRPDHDLDTLEYQARTFRHEGHKAHVHALLATPSLDRQIDGLKDISKYEADSDSLNVLNLLYGHGQGHSEPLIDEPSFELMLETNADAASAAQIAEMISWILDEIPMDPSQKQAFERTITSRKGVMLVQGPGGSGKSRLASVIIVVCAILGMRVLVTAPSNSACNNLLRAIDSLLRTLRAKREDYRQTFDDLMEKIIRFATRSQSKQEMKDKTSADLARMEAITSVEQLDSTLDETLLGLGQYTIGTRILRRAYRQQHSFSDFLRFVDMAREGHELSEDEIKSFNASLDHLTAANVGEALVIICTLNTCSDTILRQNFPAPPLIITDEAGQATEPDSYLALFGFRCKTYLMVGDDQQLPPTVMSRYANEYYEQLKTPLFTRLWNSGCAYPKETLTFNYR